MVRAENPGFFFEQSLNTFLVDVNANGDIDSRKDIVDQVDLLVLIHGSEEKIVLNNESLKPELNSAFIWRVIVLSIAKAFKSVTKYSKESGSYKQLQNDAKYAFYLARATRAFCPPLRAEPPSPTSVSSPAWSSWKSGMRAQASTTLLYHPD